MDLFPPRNRRNFLRCDWFEWGVPADGWVRLPDGSTKALAKAIIGLNPPYGVDNVLSRRFMRRAAELGPRLLAFLVPDPGPEAEQELLLGRYRKVLRDERLGLGRSFYIPGTACDAPGVKTVTQPVLLIYARVGPPAPPILRRPDRRSSEQDLPIPPRPPPPVCKPTIAATATTILSGSGESRRRHLTPLKAAANHGGGGECGARLGGLSTASNAASRLGSVSNWPTPATGAMAAAGQACLPLPRGRPRARRLSSPRPSPSRRGGGGGRAPLSPNLQTPSTPRRRRGGGVGCSERSGGVADTHMLGGQDGMGEDRRGLEALADEAARRLEQWRHGDLG